MTGHPFVGPLLLLLLALAAAGCGRPELVLQPARSSVDPDCADGFEYETASGLQRCVVLVGVPIRFDLDRVVRAHAATMERTLFGQDRSTVYVALEVDQPVEFCEPRGRFWMASLEGEWVGMSVGNCTRHGIFGGVFETAADARAAYEGTGLPFTWSGRHEAPVPLEWAIAIETCERKTLRPDPRYPVDCDTPVPGPVIRDGDDGGFHLEWPDLVPAH